MPTAASRRSTRPCTVGSSVSPPSSRCGRAATCVPVAGRGNLEGFAQLYADVAEQITARLENRPPAETSLLVPDVTAGAKGVAFITAAVASSQQNAAWVGPSAIK